MVSVASGASGSCAARRTAIEPPRERSVATTTLVRAVTLGVGVALFTIHERARPPRASGVARAGLGDPSNEREPRTTLASPPPPPPPRARVTTPRRPVANRHALLSRHA